MTSRLQESGSVCALCGQAEGHTRRCSVTRHGVDEARFRMSENTAGPAKTSSDAEAMIAGGQASVYAKTTESVVVSAKSGLWHAVWGASQVLTGEQIREFVDGTIKEVEADRA